MWFGEYPFSQPVWVTTGEANVVKSGGQGRNWVVRSGGEEKDRVVCFMVFLTKAF